MRASWWIKVAAAAGLVVAGDALFFDRWIGWTLGGFALLWVAALAAARPAVRRGRAARAALVAATILALIMVDDPGLLAWTMFWAAISLAALLPRRRFDDALRWGLRLLAHAVLALAVPADLARVRRAGRRGRRGRMRAALAHLGLPLAGSAVFAGLFALANPLVARALTLPRIAPDWPLHVAFWAIVLLAVWPSLRPHRLATRVADRPLDLALQLPGTSVASVTISLVCFNLIFAVENALDLAFLWSGAALPDGMAMTDYVHRGAYPLVATALIAGVFVLATTRPGSATAGSPAIRRLLLVWIAQNLILLGSSAARTFVYVDAYMLTEWRIAALAWMALVGLGLVLIVWRMWHGRSAAWLINRNAAAAAAVLATCTVVDLGAVAAAWNVRHAREARGAGQALDLCYLRSLGASALVSVARAERDARDLAFRDRLTWLRHDLQRDLRQQQAHWHSWTWRGARRLAAADAVTGPRPRLPRPAPHGRSCMGWPHSPPPPEPAPAAPLPQRLTAEPVR